MRKRFSSDSSMNATSHARLSARGMRKNYTLHVDSGYHSQDSNPGEKSAYGSGWVLSGADSRYLWDGVGISAHWDDYVEHSTLVEFRGILQALETIRDHHYGILHPTNHISIYCDNDSVMWMMNRRIHEGIIDSFAHEIIEKIMSFQNLVHLDFKWEKGHSTNVLNNIADKLAFFSRKDLQRFTEIGFLHMDLMLLDILRRQDAHDERLRDHIMHVDRRRGLCREHKAVELSFTVTVDKKGKREAEWFSLTGEDYDMGSFSLPKRRGSMEMIRVASSVLDAYRNSEGFDGEATILLSLPAKRSLLDDVFSVHKGHMELTENNNKVYKTFVVMKNSLDSMNVRFIQENEDYRGLASLVTEDGSLYF